MHAYRKRRETAGMPRLSGRVKTWVAAQLDHPIVHEIISTTEGIGTPSVSCYPTQIDPPSSRYSSNAEVPSLKLMMNGPMSHSRAQYACESHRAG